MIRDDGARTATATDSTESLWSSLVGPRSPIGRVTCALVPSVATAFGTVPALGQNQFPPIPSPAETLATNQTQAPPLPVEYISRVPFDTFDPFGTRTGSYRTIQLFGMENGMIVLYEPLFVLRTDENGGVFQVKYGSTEASAQLSVRVAVNAPFRSEPGADPLADFLRERGLNDQLRYHNWRYEPYPVIDGVASLVDVRSGRQLGTAYSGVVSGATELEFRFEISKDAVAEIEKLHAEGALRLRISVLFPLDATEVASFARSFSQSAVQSVSETLRKLDRVKVGNEEMLTVDQANELRRSVRVEAGSSVDFTSGEAGKAAVNAGLNLDAVIENAIREQAPKPISSLTEEAQRKLAQRFAPIIKTIVEQDETVALTTNTDEKSQETTTSVGVGVGGVLSFVPKFGMGVVVSDKILKRIEESTGLSNGKVTTAGEYVFDSIKLVVVDQQELLTAVSERATARSVKAPAERKVWELTTGWTDRVLKNILDEAATHKTLAAERGALTVRVDDLDGKITSNARELDALEETVKQDLNRKDSQRIIALEKELKASNERIEALYAALLIAEKYMFYRTLHPPTESSPSWQNFDKQRKNDQDRRQWKGYIKNKYGNQDFLPFPW